MNWVRTILTVGLLCGIAGCAFNTHGNRRGERSIVTRFAELRGKAGKPVTLVGTARAGGAGRAATLDMRGGTVEIPAYQWPPEHVDQPVMISGTLFEFPAPAKNVPRVYRLGEVESAARWSR